MALVTSTNLAADIFRTCHLEGEFLLRSGATSREYFDKYLFESCPELLRRVTRALIPYIPPETEALAGLELGGVPLAVMLSQFTDLPTVFVRKEAKAYGTRKFAEGIGVRDVRLLVIEDVVTSGGQLILSIRDLRSAGATVTDALCVIDREAGGASKLEAEGVALSELFTISELKEAGVKRIGDGTLRTPDGSVRP